MNTTYYRRIANPGGNNYIEATFDKQVYDTLASSTSTFNVFKLKDSQEQYLEKITVNSSNIDLDNSSYITTTAIQAFETLIPAKIYKITKKCLDEKGLAEKDIVVRIFINEDVNDLYGLFENLGTNYLKKITFNINTANVTNIEYMFIGASYLTEIEFKKFNSSKVTSFAGMFKNCTAITNLNLESVNSDSVQSMFHTFENCSSLETLNISNWNTSNVINMSYMFKGCKKLKNIQIGSNFKVSKVSSMTYMFSNCSALNTIGATEDTIDLSNFSGSVLCNCSYMFYEAGDRNRNITLNLGSLKVTNCTEMFRFSNFTTVNLNIYNSCSTSFMFSETQKLKSVTFSNTTESLKSNDCAYMFHNCGNITNINFNLFDTSACKHMVHMFYSCSSLETLDISRFKTSNVTSFNNMFANCKNLNKIITNQNNFVLDASVNLSSMFLNCTSLKTLGNTDNIVYIKNNNNINSCTDISYMFESCKAMTSCQLVNFTSSTLTSIGFMFGNCISLKTLNINGLGGENISNYSGSIFIFGTKNSNTNDVFGAPELTDLTINNFNLGYTLNFKEGQDHNGETIIADNILLHNCPKLTNCIFTNWIMTNVKSLHVFFYPIKNSVKTINLTGLRTSENLETMWSMFSGCTKLTTIRGLNSTSSPNLIISGVNDIAYMFNDCSSLTELNLTGFNVSDACLRTTAMFNHCEKLTKIDLSNWNTSNIEKCDSMFSNCWKLKEIVNIENFVTSACTDLHGMFSYCYELTELDLSGWNTSNVTNMSYLFYMENYCKLELITTSTKFLLNDNVNLNNIFNKNNENNDDCGNINPGKGTYYYPNLGKIIIDEDSGAEYKLANVSPPFYPVQIISGSTNSFKYGYYEYLPNNWQPQIIKRNYILARYDGSLETSDDYRYFIDPNQKYGWDIYVYSESSIGNNVTYDENNLITDINYAIFDTLQHDYFLSDSTDYKDGVYWLKICPNKNNLVHLDNLFIACRNITYIDFSTFKFRYNNKDYNSAISCLSGTFNLIQCKMSSSANTLRNTESMFSLCKSLIKFETNGFTALNITDASKMFMHCSSLKDGSQFKSLTFNNLIYAPYIFYGASNLENINFEIRSTEYIDFYRAFESCTLLKNATINFTYAKDISRMFYDCRNLESVNFNSSIYLNTDITTIPDDSDGTLNKRDTRGFGLISVFENCLKLKEVNFKRNSEINSIYTIGYVSCFKMFSGTKNLENFGIQIRRLNDITRNDGVLSTNRMFEQSMLSRESLNNDFRSNYIECYIESGCLQDTSYMFYKSGITGLTLDIIQGTSYISLPIDNMSYMFAECNVLSNIVNKQEDISEGNEKYKNHTFDLLWLETYYSCNCTGMFEGTSSKLYLYSDKSIEDFNKDLVDTYDNTTMLIDVILGPIKASDCSNMFYHGDYNKYDNVDTGKLPLYFKNIYFNNFDTAECTSIENMFRGCIYIKELNLESLDLNYVKNMDYAFYNYIHFINEYAGYDGSYNEYNPLHLPENEIIKDGSNYIINKLSVIRTYTDFNSIVSNNNLFHKDYEDAYIYTYFDGVFYYKQNAENIEKIIPITDKNPSIYVNDSEKIYNGDHEYIPNNWMGLPIIESDYFLVYYDKSRINEILASTNIPTEDINKTIINTNLEDNSDIKIFEVPVNNSDLTWGINPEITRSELYNYGFSILELDSKRFYINSNWKEIIDITSEDDLNNQSVYVVLRKRSNLSYLFEDCICNLNIIAGPQNNEITSIKGIFKNCIGLGFSHLHPDYGINYGTDYRYIYGTGNIYNLLDKITNANSDCLEELYANCSNIISHESITSINNELSQAIINNQNFDFYPIYNCVLKNENITSFANLFDNCSNIRNIVCNNDENDTKVVESINNVSKMFYNCSKLIQINKTNNITFSNISNFKSVFENCEKLEGGADSFFDLEEQPIIYTTSMFAGCKKLIFENNDTQSVGSDWNISVSTINLSKMFYNCFELSGIDMSKWNIHNVTDMSEMFYMDGNNTVNLRKINFVSDDNKLPSSVKIDNLFNKGFDNAYGDTSYSGYIYPYQTEPTTGLFTYVEGNNVKQFLPDTDKNPELINGLWSRFGDHAIIPNNWNALYVISGDDGYVLMVYRPDYTINSDGKIESFDHETLLMNSNYYNNSGEYRSHINYTTITTDNDNPEYKDDLSQLYSVAATSTYDGTAVSFETIKAYAYEKPIEGSTETTTIYMRSPYLTQDQVNASTSDYKLEDLCMQASSNVSNLLVKNVFYVENSIKNSRIIAKVKFNEYLNTFCYHSNDSNNINAGIFDNGTEDNIKLYKIDFSRSRSFWYGNDENNNDFKTYEKEHEKHIYERGLKDCCKAFYNCRLLEEIKFKDESGTYATDHWGMFTKTFNVTSYMFYGCSSLESLNINCFNTKNVEQMQYMFYGCSNLETLQFTHAQTTNIGYYIGFDTYNNLFFGYMFGECSKLSELNLKGFYFNENVILNNTEFGFFTNIESNNLTNVQYLTDMFYNCTNLQYLMLPDISRFLYRMFTNYSGENYDEFKIACIKILIRSLFNTNFIGSNAILYCEFDSIEYGNLQSLETPKWLFGDQNCTGYSDEDGTILDIMFNMLPNNWTIQPSTNKIFIYINTENITSTDPFYVIKYGDNIKAINIYDSTNFNQINNEFNIYNNPNDPNHKIYKTYYIYSNNISEYRNKYIYIQKTNSSSISGLIVEIIFKNYFDNYVNNEPDDNFDTSYLFCREGYSPAFINTNTSEINKIIINEDSNLNKIYLHSFGIRNDISEIPKFNIRYIFRSCNFLTDIFNLDILKYSTNIKNENIFLRTIIDSDVTNAFCLCYEIEFIDCFNWDTSNVTNMDGMFQYCNKLTKIGNEENTLDFSNWNTSNVENMSNIFCDINNNRKPYPTLNLTNWDTSKVTSMSMMFYSSNFEKIIGLKDFNTSNVIYLTNIFGYCSIQNFNEVEGWNTSNVKYMNGVFRWYGGSYHKDDDYIENLDLSEWNTSSVTNMEGMFNGRYNLQTLNLTGWDTSKVTIMQNMFNDCESLSEITYIENFNTTSCIYMVSMFRGCKNIESFNLQNNGNIWNTSSVINMDQMFYVCELLNDINISGWDTSNVTSMSHMFSRCRALTDDKIVHILSNIEFDKATNISNMFEDCDTVEHITNDFIGINENLADANSLFAKYGTDTKRNNLSLSTNIKNIIENAEYIHNMFSAINILNINDSDFIKYDMSHIKSLGNLFYKATLDLPICFSGNFNMVLGSNVILNDTYKQIDTSVNGIFGYCNHDGNINNLSTFDISFGTYYDNNDYYSDDLFIYSDDIFYQKQYLHYFIPTYKDSSNSNVNYDYHYSSNRYLGGLTNIFNNGINNSILLGDCFNTNLYNSFFKIYGDTDVTNKLLICNSENMANNIQNIYTDLNILYKCIVVNLTLNIPTILGNTDVIYSIFTNLLNNPTHRYFDNKNFTTAINYKGTIGKHIVTAIFMLNENTVDYNIFKTTFTYQPILNCITHIVISNSIKNMNTSLPYVEINKLEEVTIYFLPITGYEVDYNPGIIQSINRIPKNVNVNLIYDIENTEIEIPNRLNDAIYNIKCNPANTKNPSYNYYEYIIGDLTEI